MRKIKINLEPTAENQAKIREYIWAKSPEGSSKFEQAVFNLQRNRAYQEILRKLGRAEGISYLGRGRR